MNVLITGKTGYIATHLAKSLSAVHCCETVSVREGTPELSAWDVVIHCAGLVHVKEKEQARYDAVNTGLTLALAEKAKAQGVGHFIFISSMAVYGVKDRIGRRAVIDEHTPTNPVTPYGRSKLAAEKALAKLADEHFLISVLRLPMVYGKNCPGNYARLLRWVERVPVFPKLKNERSMLHIDNLCAFTRLLIEQPRGGIYCPQNREPVCTSALAALMGRALHKKIIFSRALGFLVKCCPIGPLGKIFGNLTYAPEMSAYFNDEYCVRSFEESVEG